MLHVSHRSDWRNLSKLVLRSDAFSRCLVICQFVGQLGEVGLSGEKRFDNERIELGSGAV